MKRLLLMVIALMLVCSCAMADMICGNANCGSVWPNNTTYCG